MNEEIYSVIMLEWLDSGMWGFRIEKGDIPGACFKGTYDECGEYIDTWQY